MKAEASSAVSEVQATPSACPPAPNIGHFMGQTPNQTAPVVLRIQSSQLVQPKLNYSSKSRTIGRAAGDVAARVGVVLAVASLANEAETGVLEDALAVAAAEGLEAGGGAGGEAVAGVHALRQAPCQQLLSAGAKRRMGNEEGNRPP